MRSRSDRWHFGESLTKGENHAGLKGIRPGVKKGEAVPTRKGETAWVSPGDWLFFFMSPPNPKSPSRPGKMIEGSITYGVRTRREARKRKGKEST